MQPYEDLRRRHVADAMAMAPELAQRLDWPADRLARHRVSELRRLVRTAQLRSPWHRRRLAEVDPEGLDEGTLRELPVMTKDDLMEHFDEIVTDPRLSLELVERHLEGLTTDAYLLDHYHAVASGGSSGRRAVVVHDWESWAICFLSYFRHEIRSQRIDGRPAPRVVAAVAADNPTHLSTSLLQTFSNPAFQMQRFPVTRPIAEIVAGLNLAQPQLLAGYASALHALTHEARAGRLRIAPERVASVAEPLLPEIRAAVEATWGVPVRNAWAASEVGYIGVACGRGSGMHLSEDLLIVEPVDISGAPVDPGARSAKIYVTNPCNLTLPLIRYEITDEVTLLDEPCPCGSDHRLVGDVQGRLDDGFVYGHLGVHPHVFRDALGRRRQIVEYQVRQTPRGADVAVRCEGRTDLRGLEVELTGMLARLGLEAPEVVVTMVDHIQRNVCGKLVRFVPLTATSAIPALAYEATGR